MSSRGFTLIEVVAAIFLLTVGVGAAYAVIQRTIAFAPIAFGQFTAAYLAQEGVELVRNQRDSNWLAGAAFDNTLPSGNETGLLGKFDRTIVITKPAPDKVEISAEVSWQERGRTHQVTVRGDLYDWK